MKKNIQKLILFVGFLSLLSACDMFRVEDMQISDVRELSGNERDELEKNGRFLKIINLPLNTQVSNVISVSVSNSSSTVGKLNKNSPVMIYRETDTCTAYLPLVSNDDKEFLNSGQFYTAFSVFIDALNKYIVDLSDQFIVQYTDGRGQADVNNLPSSVLAQNQQPSTSKEITENERDELEKNGHFLKLFNMPLHIQTPNVFSVSVSNSSSPVGTLDKNSPILIYREKATNTCTVYLPLVNTNGSGYLESDFLETGFFYTSFVIHVDALTKYIVDTSDQFIVQYTDGRGQADVNNLPSRTVITPDPHYLTVFNLPQTVSIYNFSKVLVLNQTGAVAKCVDYSQIVLSVDEGKAAAKIPLQYTSLSQDFTETGVFYVTFDINVDVETRYTLTLDDQVKVNFINGNGFLDILNIPDKPVPYLTIKGLPLNATKYQMSNVNIYNLAGTVAGCANNKNIVVIKENNYLTFLIPLSSSDNEYFLNTGKFVIEFTIDVDYDTQISYSYDDKVVLSFVNGSAVFDVNTFFGFFDASLTNANDSAAPVIKAGSSFDVFGHMCTFNTNYSVNVLTPSSSGIIYLYATKYLGSDIMFEYSKTVPTYDNKRRGWYSGDKRALWKMLYLYNQSPAQFLFKTYIEDDFPQMRSVDLTSNASDFSQITSQKPVVKNINGAGNPAPETITLDPGIYVIVLNGAAGGAGTCKFFDENNNTYTKFSGGPGGRVYELITLNSKTSFFAFTGSKGGDAPDPDVSASRREYFHFTTVKNLIDYSHYAPVPAPNLASLSFSLSSSSASQFNPDTYDPKSRLPAENRYPIVIPSPATITKTGSSSADLIQINSYNNASTASGGGGGGGGSGTFLLSSSANYLLVAGGGSGGSGGSCLTPGGGGGAGGTLGPGAGGGGSGTLSFSSPVPQSTIIHNFSAPGGKGGKGGGLNGGNAGEIAKDGGSVSTVLLSPVPDFTFSGGSGAKIPDLFNYISTNTSTLYFYELQAASSTATFTVTVSQRIGFDYVDKDYPYSVPYYYSSYSSTLKSTSTKIVSLSSTLSSSKDSGKGGSTASNLFANAYSAGTEGAASSSNPSMTISGKISAYSASSGTTIDATPGTPNSYWNDSQTSARASQITIEVKNENGKSSPGGNNRNTSKGGNYGDGSITIYKIY